MAKYRPPEYCLQCGKQLTPIYQDQSNLPLMQRIIGDTFMGYNPCGCSVKLPIKTEGEDEITGETTVLELDEILHEFYTTNKMGKEAGYGRQVLQKLVLSVCDAQRKIRQSSGSKPPSPAGIDVKSLAEQKAKEKYPGEMNMMGYKVNAQKNNQEKFIEGFKAGYAYKSNKSIIEWTDFLGDLGWYKVKETGRWEHDDEQGYFESTEDLVNHYLKESTPQSSTSEGGIKEKIAGILYSNKSDGGGLPKLEKPILDEDDVKGIVESSTEEEKECSICGRINGKHFACCPSENISDKEKDLWKQVIGDVIKSEQDACQFMDWPDTLLSTLQSKFKIYKR